MQVSPSQSLRIAVADDDPHVCSSFARLLKLLGHEVCCVACNGEELLEKCAETEVDVAFVDLEMPVMDGLAAAEFLAARGIPVVLVSGHPDAEEIVVELEPLVSRILKPASPEQVQQAIAAAIDSHRREHQRQTPPIKSPAHRKQ
mgnify:CR=1 FL=1